MGGAAVAQRGQNDAKGGSGERDVSEFTFKSGGSRFGVAVTNATPVLEAAQCVAERARGRRGRSGGSAARSSRRGVSSRVLGMERGDQVCDLLCVGRQREVAGFE